MSDSSNSSNSSKQKSGGNTIPQISPAKNWCFTVFNLDTNNIDNILSVLNSSNSSNNYIIGKEVCPETKKLHLQCYAEFKTKVRPKHMFEDTTIHWEKRKGTREQNIEYCSKEEVLHIKGLKVKRKPKLINPDRAWQVHLLDQLKIEPDDRTILWYYGEYGCGKTSMCKYLSVNHGAYCIGGCERHALSMVYENQECDIFIMNLPADHRQTGSLFKIIEKVKDGYFPSYFGTKATGMVVMANPHFIVMANDPPDFDVTNIDPARFVITKIT